jgi:hypothetical protein
LQLDFNQKFLSSEKFETMIVVLNICWIEDALEHLDDRESKTQYDVTAPYATWQLSYLSPLSLNLFHVFNPFNTSVTKCILQFSSPSFCTHLVI